MEENKAKVVEMQPKEEKMTYEQLEQVAHQLSEQNRQLYTKLQEANMINIFKRLDYLFKVVENGHLFAENFTDRCVKEIEELITLPKEEEQAKEEQPE